MVLTDRRMAAPRGVEEIVEAALTAGCRAIQLRDKEAGAADLLSTALRLRELTRRHGALLLVNDRVDIALAAGADGVHVGPADLPVDRIRRVVPPDFLVGYSTDDPVEAVAAVQAGADYLGSGTVWATGSKADAGAPIGPEGVDRVAAAVRVPVVAIGGIGLDGAEALARTRASGIAVLGAVMGAVDPAAVVAHLLQAFPRESARVTP
jgi:thiamine-phosphate diphosphorylase